MIDRERAWKGEALDGVLDRMRGGPWGSAWAGEDETSDELLRGIESAWHYIFQKGTYDHDTMACLDSVPLFALSSA